MSLRTPDRWSCSSLPEPAAAITAGAVRIAAATAAWLRLVAEFGERDGCCPRWPRPLRIPAADPVTCRAAR